MSRAYDSFDVQLTSLQLLYSKPGTNSILCPPYLTRLYTPFKKLSGRLVFRRGLGEGSEAEAVFPPHSGARRHESGFQQSHGGH